MFPWKMFVRFFSAVVLMATGGFAAAHDLPLPLNATSTEIVAPPAAAEPDPSTEITPVDDAVDNDNDSDTGDADTADDTTTTVADPDGTDTGGPVVEPIPVPVPGKPALPVTPAPPAVTPDPADTAAPPAAPADDDGPAVCAAAAEKVCGPAATAAPAADDSFAARVQRCQNWWNALATRLEQNGRPEWAARARQVAGRCEAMITRWQERQDRWEEKHKGDHNGDGHPDNGRGPKGDGGDDRRAPKAKPQPQSNKVSRHSEGRH
jgi:hypothetical protein